MPKKTKPPGRIEIFGQAFMLTRVQDLCNDGGETLRGQCWHDQREIALDTKLDQRQLKETLRHEIIHEILFIGGYHDESMNEGMVTCLANGLETVKVNGKPILR